MTVHPFRPLGAQPVTAVTWQGRLNNATGEGEVVGIARDFVAQFDYAQVAGLPAECRPGKLVDANDITVYAFTLAQNCTGGDTEGAVLVEKLAAFFSHASIRLARILSNPHDSADDSRQSA